MGRTYYEWFEEDLIGELEELLDENVPDTPDGERRHAAGCKAMEDFLHEIKTKGQGVGLAALHAKQRSVVLESCFKRPHQVRHEGARALFIVRTTVDVVVRTI